MTEAEWNNCADPQVMLDFLKHSASDRKLRMYAVACWRRDWNSVLVDEPNRRVVEVAELVADGQASKEDLLSIRMSARRGKRVHPIAYERAYLAAFASTYRVARESAEAAIAPDKILTAKKIEALDILYKQNYASLCEPLRCIFGNPFRPVTLDPAWRTATVQSLAHAIYDERAFDRLPILADALEDAGCANQDILHHCRQAGEHVRGCWALDLVLGRQ